MDLPKRQEILKALTYLFLVIFPFGQLVRFTLPVLEGRARIHPIEVIFLLSLLLLFNYKKFGKYPKTLVNLILFGFLSLVFSFTLFKFEEVAGGATYFVRLFSFLGVYLLFRESKKIQNIQALFLGSILASGVFGWVQYFLYPDLRFTKIFGWDDHLLRLTGTFLDPGFMGLIMVFGAILTLKKFLEKEGVLNMGLFIFFVATTLFTYSRASMLALVASVGYLLIKNKKVKEVGFGIIILAFSIFLLPRGEGVGVELERVFSIKTRLINYENTLAIFKESPVFGVGFNNLCIAKEEFLGISRQVNSCFGSDSSLLVILATMGVVGFMVLTHSFLSDVKRIKKSHKVVMYSTAIALFVHSLFVNSLFYPFVYSLFVGLFAIYEE